MASYRLAARQAVRPLRAVTSARPRLLHSPWRQYASSAKPYGSDLPWALGAVVFTVPAAAWLVSIGPLGQGDEGHGKHGNDQEDHHDEGGKEDHESSGEPDEHTGDESSEGSEGHDENHQDDKEKNKQAGDDKPKNDRKGGSAADAYPNAEANGGPKPDTSGQIAKERGEGDDKEIGDRGTKENPRILQHPEEGEEHEKGYRKTTYADAKGGYKKRIDSPGGRKQGELDTDKESSERDPAAQSKAPGPAWSNSSKQEGWSNTDTKASVDLSSNSEKSTKAEGGPETAKLKGTVDPQRPAK